MSQKYVRITLTRTEADQLREYANHRDQEGWYYGNKAQFEARHACIIRELDNALKQKEEANERTNQ